MKFTLLGFHIYEVDGMMNAKFAIETPEGRIEHDEMIRWENKEDVSLLLSIQDFIEKKVK